MPPKEHSTRCEQHRQSDTVVFCLCVSRSESLMVQLVSSNSWSVSSKRHLKLTDTDRTRKSFILDKLKRFSKDDRAEIRLGDLQES